MPRGMQAKEIVDQALKAPNPIGGGTGTFAERRAAQGADLMRYKTLLAENIPVYPDPRRCVNALARMHTYAEFREGQETR